MHMGLLEAYESASGGILDTIADMQSKAEESLSSTRKDEMEAAHAFAMLKQGLEDEIKVNKKQLGEATLTRSNVCTACSSHIIQILIFGCAPTFLIHSPDASHPSLPVGLPPKRSFPAPRPL